MYKQFWSENIINAREHSVNLDVGGGGGYYEKKVQKWLTG
jgi:hypothetical protein